jgi:hypothetical protein
VHATVTANEATDLGGGLYLAQLAQGQTITLTNTLLASNPRGGASESCAIDGAAGGAFVSGGGNLSEDASCTALDEPTDQTETEAGLDPELGDNGGPTPTHALLEGSAAIDAGVDGGIETDQRGVARSGAPDVGAVERGGEG